MKTNTQILPGIKHVFWLDARGLPPMVALQSKSQLMISILTDLHHIEIFDVAECELTSEKQNNGTKETATLKFNCGSRVPDNNNIAFVFYDNNGHPYLIGSKERPVKIGYKYRSATPSGEPAGYEYEVSHVDIKTVLPCKIYIDNV